MQSRPQFNFGEAFSKPDAIFTIPPLLDVVSNSPNRQVRLPVFSFVGDSQLQPSSTPTNVADLRGFPPRLIDPRRPRLPPRILMRCTHPSFVYSSAPVPNRRPATCSHS